MATNDLTAEVRDSTVADATSRTQMYVHIVVKDGGDWIGDFWVTFTRKHIGGERKYVADWDSVKNGGNGIYVDENPPFWPVEVAASELDEQYALQTFQAINSGKGDR